MVLSNFHKDLSILLMSIVVTVVSALTLTFMRTERGVIR
jgi:hypothetical protein